MFDFEEELKLTFLNEGDDSVQEAERLLIALERDEDKGPAIDQLFRVMHSFKGSSGGVGFTDLSRITHVAESLLLRMKNKELALTPEAVSLFLRCNDHLTASLAKLRGDLKSDTSNASLLADLEKMLNGAGGAPAAAASEPELAPPQEPAEAPAASATAPAGASAHDAGKGAAPSKNAAESIRVPLPKIEQLLNEVGELVILQTVMSQNRQGLTSPLLRNTVLQMEKILRTVQANSLSLRMLSVKPLFQKLDRIVRDTSVKLAKDVQLKTRGQESEIDKTMLEQISDPLVHVIRNSVDHGIEDPEERAAAGKPRQGTVELSAFQKGGQMVIEVRDDGRGLDPVKIRASAVKKGLIPADAKLSDEEARNLIFAPGFSTKTEVSDISGRGVGMDVVKTNVAELQGRIELQSETGKGTTIQIFLPLTLAIIDGVVVQVGDERFVVPLSQILEYNQPGADERILISERAEMLLVRREHMPLLRMDKFLKIQRKPDAKKDALSTVLIVQSNRNGKAAVMVDRVIRQQQIVIKKLSAELQGMPGVMGGAVLGDGKVAMVLDVLEWVDRCLPKAQGSKVKEAS